MDGGGEDVGEEEFETTETTTLLSGRFLPSMMTKAGVNPTANKRKLIPPNKQKYLIDLPCGRARVVNAKIWPINFRPGKVIRPSSSSLSQPDFKLPFPLNCPTPPPPSKNPIVLSLKVEIESSLLLLP